MHILCNGYNWRELYFSHLSELICSHELESDLRIGEIIVQLFFYYPEPVIYCIPVVEHFLRDVLNTAAALKIFVQSVRQS